MKCGKGRPEMRRMEIGVSGTVGDSGAVDAFS